MLNIIEDGRNEFKIKLTDKFEEEVISFLNTNGGNIDFIQRRIKDRIKNSENLTIMFKYDII